MNWNLNGLRGTRETVKAGINADKKVPRSVKDFLCAQVDELPEDVAACRLDSYCQDVSSKSDMKLTRIVQITLTGIQV